LFEDEKPVSPVSRLTEPRTIVSFAVAAGIAILDRAISYWGLMAVGAVVYMVSGKK